MKNSRQLDNPIWTSLTTGHAATARIHGSARRYPGDVSPLAGLLEPSEEAFRDLAHLVGPDEAVALFTTEPVRAPGDWRVVRARLIDQMVWTEAAAAPATPAESSPPPLALDRPDVAEMTALAAATEPGPFLTRTIVMGRYYGIRSLEGRLAAMAGERLRPGRFTEISAVCTDPDFRGRGHARTLVAYLASQIRAAGGTPFLHVKSENGAKSLYEKLGFRVRRAIQLTVIARRG
ncbi:GNAT family N-acetyltransferase [Paludisphaera mucosa]|uniref:GNAT family N-acetyltransferase n=1 Tax=Paludisphaera mucosa TaxID=3030827 RepID=A0ABT6FFF5_9BACT|nr:GNAT family N-acetyltransferase [Paludisphaera mucosa]MDG3006133.1 GNAT family N-acetyltransferase [Paludisphaera mucosa]